MPGEARGAHLMDGDDEIEAGQDGTKTGQENSGGHAHNMRVGKGAAVRGVKGPTGVHAAKDDGIDSQQAAGIEEVPAQQIEFWKGDIASADHHGNDKIAEDSGDGGNEEEPDHQHTMNGEEAIVHFGGDEIALRGDEFDTDQGGGDGGDEEIEKDRVEVKQADALVISGQKPGGEGAATFGEIVFGFGLVDEEREGGGRRMGRGGHGET